MHFRKIIFRLGFTLLLLSFLLPLNAQEQNKWLSTNNIQIVLPAFDSVKNIKGELFTKKDLLKNDFINIHELKPYISKSMMMQENNEPGWKLASVGDSSEILFAHDSAAWHIVYAASYFFLPEFSDVHFESNTNLMFECYLDGEKIASQYKVPSDSMPKAIKSNKDLMRGKHLLVYKLLLSKGKDGGALSTVISKPENLEFSASPESFMSINHLMNGKSIRDIMLSPSGKYYYIAYREIFPPEGKSTSWAEIRETESNKPVESFMQKSLSSAQWMPQSDKLTFVEKSAESADLMCYDVAKNSYKKLAQGDDLYGYSWAPDESFIIFSTSDKNNKDNSGLKKLEGMPDQWPWWRSRQQLNILFIKNRAKMQLTHGKFSSNLQDISPDSKKILFSTSEVNFKERPYSLQHLYEMDLNSGALKKIWTKNYGGSATYSPDGKQLLVLGGPLLFGDAGRNLPKGMIPNDYDTQAYLYDLEKQSVEAISKDFAPNIQRVLWKNQNIVFLVEEGSYKKAYSYSLETKAYTEQSIGADMITDISLSNKGQLACLGNSISTPGSAFSGKLNTNSYQRISAPWEEEYEFVRFGDTEDWNFKNKKNVTIHGRVYYPPDFDASKKYPLIVYYYGGTSPVGRDFGGRYPKNLFAAMGYVVYVLQPSGATGYGQEFSAMHVNNWGITTADEIIRGTKEFLKEHPFVDEKKVGCMGASYGGFMTMLLQTRTDIFAAAIAHAGISSISSYWGEGYWGYLYSSTATANSFPWNNKKIYVDQSPLFHADKIHTPLLLLHGNSDTNVPTGESRQLYTALKLLNRTVELIEIDKQDHHIVDYKKRILWQKTILAWFDKYLKDHNDWWDHLYPETNYN